MRLLLIFTALLFFIIPVSAQKEDDLTQDIAELKQDIKEIEEELADAKINYPEDVPEIQQDLDATKKLLAAMEKMAGVSSQPKPAVAKAVPPATSTYISPIVAIALSRPVSAPLPGQDTDRLLWYKGKKINDSTLITSKAMIVQYQTKKNRVVAQPEKKSDQFQDLIAELEKNEQRKNELIDKIDALKNGPLLYPDVAQAMEIYDDLNARYNNVVKNTLDLPPLPDGSGYQGGNKGGPSGPDMMVEYMSEAFDPLEQLKRAKKLYDELPPLEDFPAPPEHDIGVCGSCDKSIIEKEKKADAEWNEKYFGKEEEVIRTALGAYRQLALLSIDADAFEREHGVDINKHLAPISERMEKKNEILVKRYGKDVKRKAIIAQVVLGVERQKALLGNEESSKAITAIVEMFSEKDFVDYFNEQASARNYNFVLNIAFHLGLERQRQLLGMKDSDANLSPEVQMAIDFNRFNLSLDLNFDFEVINDDEDDDTELRANGNIWTKNKVYVFLYREGCTWMIGLSETDYNKADEKNTTIPLFVRTGTKTIRNEKDELVTYQYSGPKELFAQMPLFRIDLCNENKLDTALMMPLNYAEDVAEESGKDVIDAINKGNTESLSKTNKSYKEELLPIANHMFIDVPKTEDILGSVANLISNIFSRLSGSTISNPSGNPKLDDMNKKHNQKVIQDKAKAEISKQGMTKESVFLFNAHNGELVIIDETNDTDHRIDEYTELLKGLIHLKLVHDPADSGQVQW